MKALQYLRVGQAPMAYERLHAGDINGRAVVPPHG